MRHPKKWRWKYRYRGEGKACSYCDRAMVAGTLTHPTKDHVVPVSRGGRSRVWCCFQCNQLKGVMMPDEWAAFMLANPNWWECRG